MTQTASDLASQVKAINALLEAGEPGNISTDEHSGYTGYKPQPLIDAMNDVFGIGMWGFEEVSSELVATGDKGAMLAVAQVKVWLKDVASQPVGWGQNRVTRGDIGDARKGAQTDAIKKALSYFSIGNRAYQGLLKEGSQAADTGRNGYQQQTKAAQPTVKNTLENSPASPQQLSEIDRLVNALGRPPIVKPATYKDANALLTELSREYNGIAPDGRRAIPQAPTLAEITELFSKLYKPERWETFKQMVLGEPVHDQALIDDDRVKLWDKLVSIQKDAHKAPSGKE